MMVTAPAMAGSAPHASAAGVATAAGRAFDGTYIGADLTLRLAYDAPRARYVGSLNIAGRTYPVELAVRSASVLSGYYVAQAVEHPLVVSRVGTDLAVTRNGERIVLTRSDDAESGGDAARRTLSEALASTAPGGGVAAPLLLSGDASGIGTLLAGGITFPGGGGTGAGIDNGTGAAAAVPAFIRKGMRITYEISSSSTPAAGSTEGTGGAGFEQLTVIGVQNGVAAVESRSLAIDITARAVWHISSDTLMLPVAAGSEYWVSPAKLAAMPDGTTSGVTTVHGPYTLNGITYSAVRITTPVEGGSTQYTFDVASGMLLIWGSDSTARNGTRSIAQKRFVTMRQTAYPWAGQRTGAAVTSLRSADWSGTYGVAVDGAYDGTYPLSQHWAITRVDALTVQMKETTTLDMNDGRGPQSTTVAKTRPVPSLWIDPAVLAKLRKGQVIDDDRTTGLRTTVAGTQNGMLVITETGAIQTISSGFDLRTGLLAAVQSQLRNAPATTTIYLQRTR